MMRQDQLAVTFFDRAVKSRHYVKLFEMDLLRPYLVILCASFCANKNFAAVLVADLALQMG